MRKGTGWSEVKGLDSVSKGYRLVSSCHLCATMIDSRFEEHFTHNIIVKSYTIVTRR